MNAEKEYHEVGMTVNTSDFKSIKPAIDVFHVIDLLFDTIYGRTEPSYYRHTYLATFLPTYIDTS